MSTAVSLAAVAAFILMLRQLNLLNRSRAIVLRAKEGLAVLSHPARSDEEKETAARRASLELFGGAAVLLALTAASAIPAFCVVAMAITLHLTTFRQTLDALVSYPAMVGAVVLFAAELLWRR